MRNKRKRLRRRSSKSEARKRRKTESAPAETEPEAVGGGGSHEENDDDEGMPTFLQRMRSALGNTGRGKTVRYTKKYKRRAKRASKLIDELESERFESMLDDVIIETSKEARPPTRSQWRRRMAEEVRQRQRADLSLFMSHGSDSDSLLARKLGLHTPPFLHQLSALAWLMVREELPYKGQRAAVLADEMGAGKTLTSLMLVAMDRVCGYRFDTSLETHHEKPTLVVCPASIIDTWLEQAQTHFTASHLKVVAPSRGKRGCGTQGQSTWRHSVLARDLLKSDIVVVSYDSVRITHQEFKNELKAKARADPAAMRGTPACTDDGRISERGLELVARRLGEARDTFWGDTSEWTARHMIMFYPWRRVIFDECSHFKNARTRIAEAAEAIDAERRIFISGTPIENSVHNMFSLLRAMHLTPQDRPKLWWTRIVNSGRMKERSSHVQKGTEAATDQSEEEEGEGGEGEGEDESSVGGGDQYSEDDDESDLEDHAARNLRLRRRFLNVLQLRRSMETAPLSGQLSPYVTRYTRGKENDTWDAIVSARKQWRFRKHSSTVAAGISDRIYSSGDSDESLMSDDDDDGDRSSDVDYNGDDENSHDSRHLHGLDFAAATADKRRECADELDLYPDGFYLDTPQEEFHDAVAIVDAWLTEAFGVGLVDIDGIVGAARANLQKQGLGRVATKEQYNKVYGNPPHSWPDGTPIDAIYSDYCPRAVLLVSPMSKTEHEVNAALLKRQETRRSAFGVIASARIIASDYRCSQFSAGYLDARARLGARSIDACIPITFNVQGKAANAEAQEYAAYSLNTTQSIPSQQAAKRASDREPVYRMDCDADLAKAEKAQFAEAPAGVRFVPKEAPTKYRMLLQYLQAIPAEDKMIVFADQVRFFPLLRDYLEEYGIATGILDGDMSPKSRQTVIGRLRAPHTGRSRLRKPDAIRVLLVSLKCGAMGINLQMANHVAMFMPWFNPSVEDQCMHRVIRLSQQKRVRLVFLALLDSIDEFILAHADNITRVISEISHTPDPLLARTARYNRPSLVEARLLDVHADSVLAPDRDAGELAFVEALPRCDVLERRRLELQQITKRSHKKLSTRKLLRHFVTRHVDRATPPQQEKQDYSHDTQSAGPTHTQ